MTADSDPGPDGPPRAALIAALTLAVGAIATILGVATTRHNHLEPVTVPAVPAPAASGRSCAALIAALPDELGEFRHATIADPAPEGARAWRSRAGTQPVVLRCGLERPDDFVIGSPIQVVDRVQWFEVAAQSGGEADGSTWYTVDRPVYVSLALPTGSGPTPIQDLSAVIDATIPPVPIDPRRFR